MVISGRFVLEENLENQSLSSVYTHDHCQILHSSHAETSKQSESGMRASFALCLFNLSSLWGSSDKDYTAEKLPFEILRFSFLEAQT